MIDYEKLKIAHELAKKYGDDNNETSNITLIYYGNSEFEYYEWNSYSHNKYTFQNIDELIKKLEELTKKQAKYSIDDVVWRIEDDAPYEMAIYKIGNDEYNGTVYQDIYDSWWEEQQLYPTKESLIQAQIDYWISLREPKLMMGIVKCPDCGNDMDDYAGLGLDNKWRTGCSKQCGFIKELYKFEGEIKGFNHSEDNLEKVNQESIQHELHKKPTIGLFGNELQNQIHKEMMDNIYERLSIIEQSLFPIKIMNHPNKVK